jgi:hypothetical protein
MIILGIIALAAAVVLGAAWYSFSLRRKRRKAREVMRWIQSALAGRGHTTGISWTGASKFRVPLRLTCGVFHRACALVELRAEHTPVQWLFNRFKPPTEMLVFEADLDCPPAYSLHVHNFRWFARSSRRTPVNRPGWNFEYLQPVIISTRAAPQTEIACTMASLSRSESSEFLSISFQPHSPHFSATLSLESLAPGSPARSYVLDAMRELAGTAAFF